MAVNGALKEKGTEIETPAPRIFIEACYLEQSPRTSPGVSLPASRSGFNREFQVRCVYTSKEPRCWLCRIILKKPGLTDSWPRPAVSGKVSVVGNPD